MPYHGYIFSVELYMRDRAMVEGENASTLAESIRKKIAELKPDSPRKSDRKRDLPTRVKACPRCNEVFLDTNLVVCPKDKTLLLSPPRGEWNWFEHAKEPETIYNRCPKCEGIYGLNVRHCPDDKEELIQLAITQTKAPVLEDRYQFLSYLTSDKLFETYVAKDLTDNRIVSINFMTHSLSQDPKTVSHFLKLGKTAIGLTHPNLLSVYSVNVTQEGPQSRYRPEGHAVPYSVTEYAIANTLDVEIKRRRWFDPASASAIFIDILSALSYAHDNGITHGAIDTNNLRVAGGAGSRGIGLISNFGLAERLFRDLEWDGPSTETRTSGLYGDPDGICPEFCHAQRQSPLSDQYQIGCALYQTLCGRPPFERPATTQVLLAHMKDEPDDIRAKNSEIPAELIDVVLRCLRKNPAERYTSAKALADELKQFVN